MRPPSRHRYRQHQHFLLRRARGCWVQWSGIFVRAMLTPHDGKDSELGEIGLTTEDFLDALEFFGNEAVFRYDIRCDSRIESRFGVSHWHRTLANLRVCSIAQFIYCFE